MWRFDQGVAISRSSDGGRSWQPQFSATSGDLLAASAPDEATCWAVGRDGLVMVTTDAVHWETRPFPEKADLTGITARDIRTATLKTRDGRRFTTTDGGASWTAIQY